jgi:predicted ATP-dependent endonuclease of OLD family
MLYKKFRIANFKGIKLAEIDLSSATGANVFTLVGLNESGKTTILEAIHSFSPDYRSGRITKLSGGDDKSSAQSRVPRHKIANFTGSTTVEATIILNKTDKNCFADYALRDYGLIIDTTQIPD